jgi:uroporphyrinogen-III synthase
MNALKAKGARCVELPLVEAVPGEDAATLPDVLKRERWDWVCVTSPEAAKVFLEAYANAGRPDGVRVAVVGAGTGKVLAKAEPTTFALEKQFIPSKATAATMVDELPCDQGSLILYPASKKAATTLQDGLEARGATVVRLNTYSTERVERLDPDDIAAAVCADVVTFGSPSAVRAWVELCGDALYERLAADARALHPAYVCIGETSAEACANCELPDVFYPEFPGIDGWVETVCLALDMPIDDRWGGVDVTTYRA